MSEYIKHTTTCTFYTDTVIHKSMNNLKKKTPQKKTQSRQNKNNSPLSPAADIKERDKKLTPTVSSSVTRSLWCEMREADVPMTKSISECYCLVMECREEVTGQRW